MQVVLGFDTSCYTTSVAAVNRQGQVLRSERLLLPVESGKRGLRQSEAVFIHVGQLPKVMDQLFKALATAEMPMEICAVAASAAPRAEENSYMPVFRVGMGHAKVLASALGVPYFEFTHQQGHIVAGQIGNPAMSERFVALHLSGGTTELLLCENGKISLLGGTLDLHAGQLVDRVGVALGLPFPAGPALETLALSCKEPAQAQISASLENQDLACHLSGAETKCQQWIASGELPGPQIAFAVFDFLARTATRLLMAAAKEAGVSEALVVGGVASSTLLRSMLATRLQKAGSGLRVIFGRPEYSADNAAGIAVLGAERYNHSQGDW